MYDKAVALIGDSFFYNKVNCINMPSNLGYYSNAHAPIIIVDAYIEVIIRSVQTIYWIGVIIMFIVGIVNYAKLMFRKKKCTHIEIDKIYFGQKAEYLFRKAFDKKVDIFYHDETYTSYVFGIVHKMKETIQNLEK